MNVHKYNSFDLYQCWYKSTQKNVLKVECHKYNSLDKRDKNSNHSNFTNYKILAIPKKYTTKQEKERYIRNFYLSNYRNNRLK